MTWISFAALIKGNGFERRKVLAEGSLEEMECNEEVMEAYLGR